MNQSSPSHFETRSKWGLLFVLFTIIILLCNCQESEKPMSTSVESEEHYVRYKSEPEKPEEDQYRRQYNSSTRESIQAGSEKQEKLSKKVSHSSTLHHVDSKAKYYKWEDDISAEEPEPLAQYDNQNMYMYRMGDGEADLQAIEDALAGSTGGFTKTSKSTDRDKSQSRKKKSKPREPQKAEIPAPETIVLEAPIVDAKPVNDFIGTDHIEGKNIDTITTDGEGQGYFESEIGGFGPDGGGENSYGSGNMGLQGRIGGKRGNKAQNIIKKIPSTPNQAKIFLQQREKITGLTFKAPKGYWANTYLPGDSLVRTLQQRLTTNQNLSMGYNTPSGLELAKRSGTFKQPFDSPDKSALSVFMQADKKKVDKPRRLLLQVGIKGTSRKSGQRSAMNIGVVVDMGKKFTKAEKENLKAFLQELSKSNEVGDRFSLFIAGRPGGMIIPPGSFKHGPVTVALQELFSGKGTNKKAKPLNIVTAYLMALEKVAAGDDPTAPLGSSLVILITPGSLRNIEPLLSRFAHASAVNGVPTSLIGISDKVDTDQLDRIAISGQGNRRLLITPDHAEKVVQAELSAASRVVARVVRLRIRLAPGVKLVDVLGSQSLDEASSQKVRDAEKSIDRRLSANLGITSDRGEDEDGIQIVIPSFYADDSHVILLDLVVPGPGPVADLTVRYKDLVHLKNGISRSNLSLQRGESQTGPLEQNVIKNLLAYELSKILKQSGRLTAGNNYMEAHKQMNQFTELLKTMKQEVKGFSTDPELESDLELVMNYLLALDSARRGNLSRTNDLSDSLFYAGHLKLLGPR